MIKEFIDWLYYAVGDFFGCVSLAMMKILCWVVALVFLPIWIIPFLFWYFAIYTKGENEK